MKKIDFDYLRLFHTVSFAFRFDSRRATSIGRRVEKKINIWVSLQIFFVLLFEQEPRRELLTILCLS